MLATHPPDIGRFWQGDGQALIAELPPVMRLAASYAPAASRGLWLGFFTLDRRFAQIVATVREPMLAQMRLAWWRETLGAPAEERPAGDLLLEALRQWRDSSALAALADGWEALLGEAPLDAAAFAALAGARADAAAAIAREGGHKSDVAAARDFTYVWALRDIATHLTDEAERKSVASLLRAAVGTAGRAPRIARPVAILGKLASGPGSGPATFVTAVRIGLIGR